jgi:hypothetical protein
MIFVWGKKQKVKDLGFVADYCIICRQIQPFFVQEIGMVSHVYWIPHGDVEVMGHIGICVVCEVSMGVDPQTYKGFSPDCDSGIERLIADTYPTIREDLSERLELYERAKRYAAINSEEARRNVILEPLLLLAPLVQEKFGGNVVLGPAAAVSCICTVFLPIALLIVGCVMQAYIWFILSGTSIVLGIVITWLLQKRHRRSFFRKSILPTLAHSLRELNPKIQEVENALESCAGHGLKIGTEFSGEEVLHAIQEAQQSLKRYSEKSMDANGLLTKQSDGLIDPRGGWPIK